MTNLDNLINKYLKSWTSQKQDRLVLKNASDFSVQVVGNI